MICVCMLYGRFEEKKRGVCAQFAAPKIQRIRVFVSGIDTGGVGRGGSAAGDDGGGGGVDDG